MELRQFPFNSVSVGRTEYDAVFYGNKAWDEQARRDDGVQNFDQAVFQPPAPLPARFKAIPAPPFMVPAAIEYLRTHLNALTSKPPSAPQPGQVTTADPQIPQPQIEIARGEADTYCAAHAKKTGAAILTSDSDLLAYDLGSKGSVIFFNSLELSTRLLAEEDGHAVPKKVLLGTRYHATSLSSKLGVSCSLQRFCFHRSLDPTISTSELKIQCRKRSNLQLRLSTTEEEQRWRRFLWLYSTDDVVIINHDQGEGGQSKNTRRERHRNPTLQIQGLDPRVAELVTQFQDLNTRPDAAPTEDGKAKHADEDKDENVVHMYLPLLIEDPSRDSAWSYGRSIRLLAYTLLQRCIPLPGFTKTGELRSPRMYEYQRRGSRIVGLPIELAPTGCQIEPLLQSYHAHQARNLSSPKTTIGVSTSASASASAPLSTTHFWKSFALALVSQQRVSDGKIPPDNAWAERYINLHQFAYVPSSWDDVHSQASLEAVLYSLRMLKQVADLVVGYSSVANGEEEEETEGRLRELVEILAYLPSIVETMGAEQVEIREPPKGEEMGAESEEWSQSRGQRMNWEAQCVGNAEGDRERVKRQCTSIENKQVKRVRETTTRNELARGQGRKAENMFALLEDAAE